MKIKANHIDVYIGQMIRHFRHARGVAQQDIADMLGISFQQVQKYERGVNRISAASLLHIAHFLDFPVAAFLPGHPSPLRSAYPEREDSEGA